MTQYYRPEDQKYYNEVTAASALGLNGVNPDNCEGVGLYTFGSRLKPQITATQRATFNKIPTLINGKYITEWTITDVPFGELYPTAEAAKQAVKGWIEKLLNQITDRYPRQEIDSWATKNEAARAVMADNARPDQTALIQAEADALGETLLNQATLVIAKADQFSAIISLTSGIRQQVDASLDAASTPAEYGAIISAALTKATVEAAAVNIYPPAETGWTPFGA